MDPHGMIGRQSILIDQQLEGLPAAFAGDDFPFDAGV